MHWLLDGLAVPGAEPHGFCLQWDTALIGLHVFSDTVIGLSYYMISAALAYFVLRREDLIFGWLFWMFGFFILACGTTHLFDVWVLWHPDYVLQGAVKGVTALASLGTAVMLWPLIPKALALPSPMQLRSVNERLSVEIREHSQALEALRRSEERYRLVVEGLADHAIFMLDSEGRVTSWDHGAERFTGYSAGEILGRPFVGFFAPEDQERDLPARALETAAREGRYEAEVVHLRKCGIRFWANIVIYPIHDDNGRLFGFAKIARDITVQRCEREMLDETRAALAQSQKMEAIGQLTGGVAHDFNNLLTTILGNIELVERRIQADRPDLLRLLQAATRAAERGAGLTQRLLAFSRRQMLAPRLADLNALVEGMSDLLHRTLGETIRVKTVLAPDLWRSFADPNQLENALLNLAVNARDAMPEGGMLTIETANVAADTASGTVLEKRGLKLFPGDYVRIAVTDTGTGMSEDVRNRAFEPFFTTKKAGQGTGLGLSQIYGFVKQSGGDVSIHSRPGAGTVVSIYLPRHPDEEMSEAVPATPGASLPTGSGTILLVEDDPDVRAFTTDALTQLGYQVLQAENAGSALDMLAANPGIRLLFTDIVLPDLNGRQLAERARTASPGLKVLFTTGYDRNTMRENAPDQQEDNLLMKPFSMQSLARKVKRMLPS